MNSVSAPARETGRRRIRIAILVASVAAAIVGSALLATRDSGERTTSRGVTATLRVPGHPGSVATGRDALWFALADAKRPIRKQPLLRLDLASDALGRPVDVGGQASYLLHAGDRLLASVAHDGSAGSGPSLIVALDWRTGDLLASRQYTGAIGPLVQSGEDVWALQTEPAALIRLDGATMAPKAAPLELSPGRSVGLAVGAGYVWVTAADPGRLLRIDPATRKITALQTGGSPTGIVVVGGSVWFADRERGTVARIEPQTLRPIGDPIDVGTEPSSLAAAGDYLFVGRASLGTVTRIGVRAGRKVGAPIRFVKPTKHASAFALAPSGTSVWVSTFASSTLTRISSTGVGTPTPAATVSSDHQSASGARRLPRGATVVASIAIPPGSGGFAIGESAVWSVSDSTGKLLRIDPDRNAAVDQIDVDGGGEVAEGDGSVWLTHPDKNTVSRIDPVTHEVTAPIAVGKRPLGIAVTPEAVWVANADAPSVSRIDPATNKVVRTIRVGPATACCGLHMGVIVAGGAVWANVANGNRVARIDPKTNDTTIIELDYAPCAGLDADESTVWSTGGGCADIVAHIDVKTKKVTKLAEPHPIGVALAFGTIWVASLGAHNVDRVDVHTNQVVARLPVRGAPIQLLAGFGSVWVHDDEGHILRLSPTR